MDQLDYLRGIQENVDKNTAVKMLREILAGEFISIHRYWTQSKVVQGLYRDEIKKILGDHREIGLKHADLLSSRILQLGGNPELRPLDWDNITRCHYTQHVSWDQHEVLENAITHKRCLTNQYSKVAEFVKERDTTTHEIIMSCLNDDYKTIKELNILNTKMNEDK